MDRGLECECMAFTKESQALVLDSEAVRWGDGAQGTCRGLVEEEKGMKAGVGGSGLGVKTPAPCNLPRKWPSGQRAEALAKAISPPCFLALLRALLLAPEVRRNPEGEQRRVRRGWAGNKPRPLTLGPSFPGGWSQPC